MYRVTDILREPKSHEVTVLLEGNSYRITAKDAEFIGISVGDTVDENVIELLDEAVNRLACIKKAFDHLSYGDLSQKQLYEKLCRKFDKKLANGVAEFMAERGYVNDRKLAERYAETFYVFKNMGVGKIRDQLYRRGISPDIIDEVVDKYREEDQAERIRTFIAKKYDIKKLKDVVYRRKVYSGCMRAGFSSADIADVLRNFETDFESEFL